ncbi:uncharacterized protein B0I36DRAFT_322115 [Microdochium trichocladiopsis]|uniref:Uncharacterized protein n=1 Tax=Microdochium trichocladiopsis TaxID=1682393 RepID=A0A9P8Y7V4_9PEZI|nr:uncharacterized protein B0I36DRAFT_322115 [Microdochium trichocladiopsis]KAH7030606.1 hypothetical protein B0I36DRAFT_322115 [Microdochium trichocladiopsis]
MRGNRPTRDRTYLTRFLSADLELENPRDETGRIKHAALKLIGLCAVLRAGKRSPYSMAHKHASWQVKRIEGLRGQVHTRTDTLYEGDPTDIDFDSLDDIWKTSLLLWISTGPMEDEELMHKGWGLVLVRAGAGTFRRVGIMEAYFENQERALAFSKDFERRRVVVV